MGATRAKAPTYSMTEFSTMSGIPRDAVLACLRAGMPYVEAGDWESGKGFVLRTAHAIDWMNHTGFALRTLGARDLQGRLGL
jgi:hypothetical protein